MVLNIDKWERINRSVLIASIWFEVLLVCVYLGSIILTGHPYPAFDMDGLRTVPSMLQALYLLALGLVALTLFFLQPQVTALPSRSLLLTLGILFVYAAIDEVWKVHLQFDRLFPWQHHQWLAAYVGVAFGLPVFFYRDVIALWQHYRSATRFTLLGLCIFGLGGFATEIFTTVFLKPFLLNNFQFDDTIRFVLSVKVAVEEFLELLGENFVLYGVVSIAIHRLALNVHPFSSSHEP
jgi:hypothetical protein